MNEKILEALKKLDPKVDSFWTQEGLVNLNAFKFTLGESATRDDLEAAWPGFNRDVAAGTETPKIESAVIEGTVITQGTTQDSETQTLDASLNLGVNVDTEEVEHITDNLLRVIGFLRAPKEDLSEVSDADLRLISEQQEDIRNAINLARTEFDALVLAGLHQLSAVVGEVEKRTPVESISDQVKRIHAANAGVVYDIDKPRQRVVTPQPPLARK